MEVQLDFEDVKNSDLHSFLEKTFVSKLSGSTKNVRRGMFYVSKTLSALEAIRE